MLRSHLRAILLRSVIAVGFLSRTAAGDFAELTALAEGALVGDNVSTPVSGFDIRILHHGQPIYHQSFGDWSLDRVANIDSSTKTLSGALMVSVAETQDSGFSLDSALADFLTSFDKPGHRDITIRQAFSHTSSLPGSEFGFALLSPNITLLQSANLISLQQLAMSPPGELFDYGGLSMQAAGAAAEVATGLQFVDLMSQRITTPLEMTSTEFVIASDSNPRVAGGMVSNASEYSRFMDMLLNDGVDRPTGTRVLAPSSVAEMLTSQTDQVQTIDNTPIDNARYGIGVWLEQLRQFGPGVDFIAGGARGFHSWVDIDQGLVFTLATDQSSFGNLESLSSQMHRAVLAELLLPGNYNDDGTVDSADYTVWRDNQGNSADTIQNVIDPGPIGATHYQTWRANFGRTLTHMQPQSVPEPTDFYLTATLMACIFLRGLRDQNLRAR